MDIKNTISSTEARQKFAEVIDNIDRTSARYTLTVNGKPKVVMVNAEEFESWQETWEIMSDPELMAGIRQGEEDIRQGRFITLDELKKELELEDERPKKR